jgi:hypothetical protein
MGSDTHFDPTGEKKARKQATFRGAIICAFFNVFLGVILGVVGLATFAPTEYQPKADVMSGKIAPPPAGLFYWAGAPGGDYQIKEDQFLASQPGGVTVTDGELNTWAATMFKSDVGQASPDAKKPATHLLTSLSGIDASKAKAAVAAGVKTAEADFKTWGVKAGTPNFHAFKDPQAPADVPISFQIALPMTITLFGTDFDTVYQARGTFVDSPTGPHFKPYYSFLGHARIPVLPGLAQKIFNTFAAKYAGGDDLKKHADAWAKLSHASMQDGALVLGGK